MSKISVLMFFMCLSVFVNSQIFYCFEDEIQTIMDNINDKCICVGCWNSTNCKNAVATCARYATHDCCKCYSFNVRKRCDCIKGGSSVETC